MRRPGRGLVWRIAVEGLREIRASMETTPIPNTDLIPSSICFGTASIGVNNTEWEARALLDAFIEQGGNFIDTARMYSNWHPGERNRSERIIGEWMKERKSRAHLVLATKGGHPDEHSLIHRLSPEQLKEDLNASLQSLQTDRIDLYWLHRDDLRRPLEPMLDSLHGFQQAGKIRYYACSNWTPGRIREAQTYTGKQGYSGFVASQIRWSLGSYHMKPSSDTTLQTFDQEHLDMHRQTGLPAIPFSSQAQGYFPKLPGDPEALAKNSYHTSGNLAIHSYLEALAVKAGMSISQLVLAYLWSHSFPVIPIVGCRTQEQLDDSVTAVGSSLQEDAMTELARLTGTV